VAQLKFEKALSRLEAMVQALEKGDLPLEEALKVFGEGIRLSKQCMKTLSEVEKKVEIMINGKDGNKEIRPFGFESEKRSKGGASPEQPSPKEVIT